MMRRNFLREFNLAVMQAASVPRTMGTNGDRVVSSVEDYRANADECMDWARTARSERERLIFIQMAQTWQQAAMLLEACRKNDKPKELTKSECA
jgi:hypothetical protein